MFEPHVVHELEAKLRVVEGNAQLSKVTGKVHGQVGVPVDDVVLRFGFVGEAASAETP